MFTNRKEAGRQLANKLEMYRDSDAVVLTLPRGGVPIGYEIAMRLHLQLDIVVTRKIGYPLNPEYAICAVEEHGMFICNESERALVDEKWFQEEVDRQRKEAARRTSLYRSGRDPVILKGREVIITDDGVATGLTIDLAIMMVKKQQPAKVILAVPVAPEDTLEWLRREVNEVIVLLPPHMFLGGVGAYYEDFGQVKDDEVIDLLGRAHKYATNPSDEKQK